MHTISSIMLEEHENILAVVQSVEQNIEKLEDDFDLDKDYYFSVLQFLREYADGVHHAKEEDILFKVVADLELDKQDEEIKRLVHQHIISRDIFGRIEENISNSNINKLIANFKQYISMIRAHIKEEDELLFPLLEKSLNKASKELILTRFKEADAEINMVKYMDLKEQIKSV